MILADQSINQSINQSKHISIAPFVASESEARMGWFYPYRSFKHSKWWRHSL